MLDSWTYPPGSIILGDDFLCTDTTRITEITLWGSWIPGDFGSFLPTAIFWVGIWSDVPAQGEIPSHPGQLLWAEILSNISGVLEANPQIEHFYDPHQGVIAMDDNVYRYTLNPMSPFLQLGSPNCPAVYWLTVTAIPVEDGWYGWKTTPPESHWNDNGVWGHMSSTGEVNDWMSLRHPYYQYSLNLAFSLKGEPAIDTIDWGDAPSPYPTLQANNGANHPVGALLLGSRVDAENNGQPNADATGDDLAGGIDDEDGVQFNTALISGVPSSVTVTCVNPCAVPSYLQGWIDFNMDGDWNDEGEQIIKDFMLTSLMHTNWFNVPTILRSGRTYARFRLSSVQGLGHSGAARDGEVEDYAVTLYPLKWLQPPNLTWTGADVSNYEFPLADDFKCTQTGPITDIHLWGSFFEDAPVSGGPGNMTIELTIYSDVPAGQGGSYSHPGSVLWQRVFAPGQYTAGLCATVVDGEWWHEPWPLQPFWQFPGDFNCYQFDFYIDPSEAYTQTEGTIYWLGLKYLSENQNFRFGWKTTDDYNRFNDDACYLYDIWWPLVYGGEHPYSPESLDLAFALSTPTETLDFGDLPELTASGAPTGYATRLANNGPRHVIVRTLKLGASTDTEGDGQPTVSADGDDLNGATPDDEEGVASASLTGMIRGGTATVPVTVFNNTGGNATLWGWIDFDADAAVDTGETQTAAAASSGSPQTVNLTFSVPANAAASTYARFRLGTVAGEVTPPTGWASNGEVEDYPATTITPGLDFGDAPAPFPTLLPNGARHVITGLFMGARVDAENDGQPNASATGDDVNPAALDDEDGVQFNTALISGVPSSVTVTCSATGILQGWIDFNVDGDWDDLGEQIIKDYLVGAGVNPNIQFTVPAALGTGQTYARFRLSAQRNLGYSGLALSGEVEDYAVTLYQLKWLQPPNLDWTGVDVDNSSVPLADDFLCTQTGPITDIHLWGSFLSDHIPPDGPANMTIELAIYADVPVGPNIPYSHPGDRLWNKTFRPGQFDAGLCYHVVDGEWWHDPVLMQWIHPGDFNCYQFDFYVDPAEAFQQVEGRIYWLGLKYYFNDPEIRFGWKTSYEQWNDDACYLGENGPAPAWRPLVYGGGHPWEPASMDLAFALSGPPAPCQEVPLVTSFTPGTVRNNYTGWLGMRLLVGASPLDVRSLGRVYLNGNVQNHELRLVRASDGVTVASTIWTPTGGSDKQIKHMPLAVPVMLDANTEYYLASQETSGGDQWFHRDTTVVTTTAATVQSPIYSSDGTVWTVPGGSTPGTSYIPVSLDYCGSGGGGSRGVAPLWASVGDEAWDISAGAQGEGAVAEQKGQPSALDVWPHVSPLPASTLTDGYLVLSYLRAKPNPGCAYVIESSADLEVWESTEGLIEERVTELDATAERVDAVYLVPTDQVPQRFLRLRVVPEE